LILRDDAAFINLVKELEADDSNDGFFPAMHDPRLFGQIAAAKFAIE